MQLSDQLITALYVLTGVLIFVFIFFYSRYNKFVKLRNRVNTDYSDIEVQLGRRGSLIQNLADLVREYAKHENKTFTRVAEARSMLENAENPNEKAQADNMLTETLRSLFMVSEAYPELKATTNYQNLRTDLLETENVIAAYREEYNMSVEEYNNAIQTFPNLVAATVFGYEARQLFESSGSFKIEEPQVSKEKQAKKNEK